MPKPRTWLPLLVAAILIGIAAGTLGADYRPTSRLAWAFEGVFDTARAGDILYLAGDFTAVAPIGNVASKLVELQTTGSATPSRPLPGADGQVSVVLPDGAADTSWVGGSRPSAAPPRRPWPMFGRMARWMRPSRRRLHRWETRCHRSRVSPSPAVSSTSADISHRSMARLARAPRQST